MGINARALIPDSRPITGCMSGCQVCLYLRNSTRFVGTRRYRYINGIKRST